MAGGNVSFSIPVGGDDEDYKRIYTKKIKPRLKSEDLAEGVDVRTERHSSTSSDGWHHYYSHSSNNYLHCGLPGGTSQQIEHSSPEFKMQVLQNEQSEGDSTQSDYHIVALVSGAHEV